MAQYIAYSQAQSPNPTGAITMEGWVKTSAPNTMGGWGTPVLSKADNDQSNSYSYALYYTMNEYPTGLLKATDGSLVYSNQYWENSDWFWMTFNDGNWHQIVVTASADGTVALYIDANTPVPVVNSWKTLLATAPDRLAIGAIGLVGPGTTAYANAVIDEVRISNSVRSSDWIATEHASQGSPATFYSISPENMALYSVTPASGILGAVESVTLTGTAFAAGDGISVDNYCFNAFGQPYPAIAVSDLTVVSTTQLTATLTICPQATVGPSRLTVTTPSGTSNPVLFVVNPAQTAAPTFSVASGTYTTAVTVALATTYGATIRYTTDGSQPSETVGTVYTGPITVSRTTTINAIGYEPGLTDSSVASAAYAIVAAVPTFTPATGASNSPLTVTISSATPGAIIRYTTDGSQPTETVGTVYTAPVVVNMTTTINAIAYGTGLSDSAVTAAAYTIVVAPPTFSPAPGTYGAQQVVALSTTTAGASIRYTTDGSQPTRAVGTLYAGAFTVSGTTNIQAIAFETGLADSSISTGLYSIQVAAPTFNPPQGAYAAAQTVAISSSTQGAIIRYTTNGGTPTETLGILYTAPVAVASTTKISALAYASGLTDSPAVSAGYTISGTVATPTFSPGPGTYLSAQSVTIRTSTSGASIRYTTDGSQPSETAGTLYSGPVAISATTTVNAIAYKSGSIDSMITPATYTITPPVVAPTFDPPGGIYSSLQSVTISSATPGAMIHYTSSYTSPLTPSRTVGNPYVWPVTVVGQVTISAIAYKDGMPDSSVSTATYQISPPANGLAVGPDQIMLLPLETVDLSKFTFTGLTYASSGVQWSATPSDVGILDGYRYQAPADFAPGQIVQLVGTDPANASQYATVLVHFTSHLRLNAGGNWYADPVGNLWSGDAALLYSDFKDLDECSSYLYGPIGCYFSDTQVTASDQTPDYAYTDQTPNPWINYTQASPYYSYYFYVPEGSYDVGVHLVADPSWPGPGSVYARADNASNGTFQAGSSLNIPDAIAAGGGAWGLYDAQLTAAVPPDPNYRLQLLAVTLNVAGIEVQRSTNLEAAPAKAALGPLQTQQFSAHGGPVTWGISPPGTGAITANGLYTAPASGTVQTISVTATSVNNPNTVTTAQVYLLDHYAYPLTFTGISPAAVNVTPSQPLQLTAVGNTAVNWSISPTGIGTFTDGLYTAPAIIDSPQTLTVTATSQLNPGQSYTAQINLVPLVGITITPANATVFPSRTLQFSASVTGNSNTGVTWSLSTTTSDTLSANGLYTSPATVSSPQTSTVTVTSLADPTKSASATVNLEPRVTTSLSPQAVTLAPGQQQQFTALVFSADNTAVTWSIIPAESGSITPQGLYTAPAPFTAPQFVTVTATSQDDPLTTASATVTLVPASVSIALTPNTATLYGGQSLQFAATVANTGNAAVAWTVNPSVGSISSGLYQAPASITAQQTVTVFATSQADTTKTTSALVTLLPPPSGPLQLAPNTGQVGKFLHVAITGLGTNFVQGVTKAQFGPGTEVGGGLVGAFGPVTVTSPTTAIAQVSIIKNAPYGPQTVTVQTGTETVSLANGFGITLPPAITSFGPTSTQPGQTLSVAIKGTFTNFVPGITEVNFGPGVSVGGAPSGAFGPVTVTSPTDITAQITVDPAAPLGPMAPVAQTGAEQATFAGGFTVLGTITGAPPTVGISSPTEGAVITDRTPITGTITSPNLASWTLTYKLADANTWTQFAAGDSSTVNGTFDPTMLLNGTVQIQLTALDASGQATSAITNVIVSGNLKVGLFTLAYTDLSVPLGGIPIQVIRTYDSRNPNVGDFGFGWTLGIKSVRVTANGAIGDGWQGQYQWASYCIVPSRPHTVAITFPNGQQYTFETTLTTPCGNGGTAVGFTPSGTTPANAGLIMAGSNSGLIQSPYPNEGAAQLLAADSLAPEDPDQYILTMPDGRQLVVSQQNGLQQITDLNGNNVTFTPDEIRQSNGGNVQFARDAQGRVSSLTDPSGKQITYTYTDAGDLVGVVNQANGASSYTYNNTHGMLSYTDPRGIQAVRTEYDTDGRLVSQTDALGHTINYVHDLDDRQEIVTDRLGRTTVNEYDTAGNVVATTDPTGATTTRTFDANGNVLSMTDALGRTTNYTYDANNNLLTQQDRLLDWTTYTYDANSRPLTITDALYRVTTNVYDPQGNLTSTTDAANNTTTYAYNAQGMRTSVTDVMGGLTSYQYDDWGELAQQTDALNHVTSYTYDQNGNRITQTTTRTTQTGPETLTTTYQYDDLGRRVQTTNPDGSITKTSYDAIGNVSGRTDGLNRQTSYTYDDDGRLLTTTYPDSTTEQTVYDAEGNRISFTDRGGHLTSYVYDGDNRLTTTTYADGAVESTAYDLVGNAVSRTDARGNQTLSSYDAVDRLVMVTDPLGNVTTYTYDRAGNQLSATDARGNKSQFQYDALNRRITTTYPDGTTDQLVYDALGRNTSKTDQAGRTTQFGYDKLGRLTTVTDALNQITSYGYDEVGSQISQTDANNHVTTYQYDKMRRRTQRTLPLSMSESMTYDAGGNLQTRTDFNGKTTTFGYDSMNRLLTKTPDASFGEPVIQFTYTASGRRASMVDASGTTNYTFSSVQGLSGPPKESYRRSYCLFL